MSFKVSLAADLVQQSFSASSSMQSLQQYRPISWLLRFSWVVQYCRFLQSFRASLKNGPSLLLL
jgi:hypothetical protein